MKERSKNDQRSKMASRCCSSSYKHTFGTREIGWEDESVSDRTPFWSFDGIVIGWWEDILKRGGGTSNEVVV